MNSLNIIKYTNRLNISKLSPINPSQIDSIAIHHMDHLTAGINEVCSWHMDEPDKKWSWIGYSYWIGFDGTIYECRGIKYLAAGVKDNNGHIVSIGFQGKYSQNNTMPEAQYKAGVELIKYLKTQLVNVKTIAGHKNWNDTSCPGDFFPLTKMIGDATKMNTPTPQIDEELKGIIEILASYTNSDGSPMMNKDYWLANTVAGSSPNPLYVAQLIKNLSKKIIW